MKYRHAKKALNRVLYDSNIKPLKTEGRTIIIPPGHNIKCIRWGMYAVVSIDHEQLLAILSEPRNQRR